LEQKAMRVYRMVLVGLMLALLAGVVIPAYAQGNLLQNASFDGAYTGRGTISGGVPDGWNTWGSFQNSDHEALGTLVASAPYSWRLRTESGLPTGGGYQTVTAQSGASYRFTVSALIWTCDDPQWQCRDNTHTFSDTSSGGRLRIGIDPSGGSDPYSGNIRWSGFASPFDWGHFAGLSIDATASAGQITVFTYYTADKAMRFNDVFWDDASLVMTGSGGSSGSSGTGPQNTAAPVPTAAPVVANAQTRPDGSQVHIVQPGQTLWGIAQVYGVSLDTLRQLNGISGSTIYAGQAIIIKAATVTSSATPPPTITPASITPITTQPPTLIAAATTPLPVQQVAALVDAPEKPSSEDSSSDSGPRSVVLALAVVILLGAVAITGGLAGFLAYKVFKT
jgi:LysM repeat protein